MKAYQHPVFIFLLKAAGVYVLWVLLYDLWLHPAGQLDSWVIQNSIFFTIHLLEMIGYQLHAAGRIIGIMESPGVWIGDSCNAVSLFALFAGFVLIYPGRWLHKLYFIPIGIILIHLLNVIRIAALLLLQKYAPDTLDFNHTYTFTIVIYAVIFALWMFWINKNTKHA